MTLALATPNWTRCGHLLQVGLNRVSLLRIWNWDQKDVGLRMRMEPQRYKLGALGWSRVGEERKAHPPSENTKQERRQSKSLWEGGCLAPEGSSFLVPEPSLSTKALLKVPWAWRMNSFSYCSQLHMFSDPCNCRTQDEIENRKTLELIGLRHFHLPAGHFAL